MTEKPHTCTRCGAELSADTAGGLCPRCLMALNFDSRTMPDGEGPSSIPPLSPEELADKFPQYEILECLGRGGMGVVYKARQKALDRMVAIKVLAGEWQGDPGFAARFEREAKTLAQMSHPNIVTVHDFGEADGLFYIVMEFIDDVNLRDLLREGKMDPEQALAIVPPVCEALEYAHGKGVVHRDIKPENLLLDRDGRIKIADFGIASLIGATGEKSGTPPYMAPEQETGNVDRRADIYALGVVLYEMLTGERPTKDIVAPSRKVQIDVKIDEMVLRALEKEPERRYQTAGEFRTVVEDMTIPSVVAAKPEQPVTDVVKPAISSKWALGILLASVLAGLTLWDAIDEQFLTIAVGVVSLLALILGVKGWRSRLGKPTTLAAGVWLVGWLTFTVGFYSPWGSLHRYTNQSLYPILQVPKDHGGVLVVAHSVPGYPELPIRGEHQILRFPKDGLLITSSSPRYTASATRVIETYNPESGSELEGYALTCMVADQTEGTTAEGAKFSYFIFEVGDSLYWQRRKGPKNRRVLLGEARQRVLARLELDQATEAGQNGLHGQTIPSIYNPRTGVQGFDFESGRLFSAAVEVADELRSVVSVAQSRKTPRGTGPFFEWLEKTGVDAVAASWDSGAELWFIDRSEVDHTIHPLDGSLAGVDPLEVVLKPSQQLTKRPFLRMQRAGYLGWPREPKNEFLAFRTREGNRGVLQVIGITDDKVRGVRVRYKLANGAKFPAGFHPTAKADATSTPPPPSLAQREYGLETESAKPADLKEGAHWYPWAEYIKRGDLQRMQGDLPGALENYRKSLAAAETAVAKKPSDVRLRNVAESHLRIGDAQSATGDLKAALTSYERTVAILNKCDPGLALRKDNTVSALVKLGDVQHALGDRETARETHRRALAIATKMPPDLDWKKDVFRLLPIDYKPTEIFDAEELTRLAQQPLQANDSGNHDRLRRLMWLICRAGAENDGSFRNLLERDDLRRNAELNLALAGYDYSVNGNGKALDYLLAKLAREVVGSDSSVVCVLEFIDEWDRSTKAVDAHFTATDGAGGIAKNSFWMTRQYLFPRKFLEYLGKAGEGAPVAASAPSFTLRWVAKADEADSVELPDATKARVRYADGRVEEEHLKVSKKWQLEPKMIREVGWSQWKGPDRSLFLTLKNEADMLALQKATQERLGDEIAAVWQGQVIGVLKVEKSLSNGLKIPLRMGDKEASELEKALKAAASQETSGAAVIDGQALEPQVRDSGATTTALQLIEAEEAIKRANEYLDLIIAMTDAKVAGRGEKHPSMIVPKNALARFKARYPSLPDSICIELAAKRIEEMKEQLASMHDSGLGSVHPTVLRLQARIDALQKVSDIQKPRPEGPDEGALPAYWGDRVIVTPPDED